MYSNIYNLGWKDYQSFKWSNNQTLNANQGGQQVRKAPQHKPSPLEETLGNFLKATQSSFEQVNKNQEDMFKTQKEISQNHTTMNNNTEALIKKLRDASRPIVSTNSNPR